MLSAIIKDVGDIKELTVPPRPREKITIDKTVLIGNCTVSGN